MNGNDINGNNRFSGEQTGVKKHATIMTTIILVIIAFSALFLAVNSYLNPPVINIYQESTGSSSSANSVSVKEQNTILVKGSYDEEVDPDLAKIVIEIKTEGDTAKEASEKNREITSNVKKALLRSGLSEEEVIDKNVWLNKKRDYNPVTGKFEYKGYEETTTLEIKTKKIDKLSYYVGIAISNGATGVRDLEFTLSKEAKRDLEEELLKSAAEDARKKAEVLAEALGKRVVEVVRIDEESRSFTPYTKYINYNAYSDGSMLADTASASYSPGKVSTGTSVSVIFRMG